MKPITIKISIIIPVFNSENTIFNLVSNLVQVLKNHHIEIILVNDGSKDNSDRECRKAYEKFSSKVAYYKLGKNFGEHNAVLAGLNQCTGDYAVIIDDDFQNPPEEIPYIVNEIITQDYDVLYTYYDKKKHHFFRNLGSKFNDRVATFLIGKPEDLYLSSFKCLNRFLIDEIIKYRGPYPYIDGLILRSTMNIGKVKVQHNPRLDGTSNYTIRRLIRLWLNVVVNFSIMPLRLSFLAGTLLTVFGLLLIIFFFLQKYFLMPEDIWPAGWASLLVSVIVFSGTQLISLGLIGEYIGKSYLTENGTPQYVIRHSLVKQRTGKK